MRLTVHPGTRVADRFTILRFIAEGGMGEVYEALDEVLGERVALKFLSQRNVGDESVARRFRREVQLARKVTHPNVCRLFDVFTHKVTLPGLDREVEVAFVTMEMLRGETLEDRIARGGRLSEDEALPIVVQMGRALDAAHEAGIVHRDFKSNNVMLVPGKSGRLRAVVTDFGLARSMLPSDPTRTPLTADQLILGTAEYMSPEQIQGEPVSPKSDLYAFGVVMFEMLTGAKPYSAPNPMQLLVKRVSEPPASPRDFRPDISELWETVILACLEEEPDRRPGSAQEVLMHLGVTESFNGLPGGGRAAYDSDGHPLSSSSGALSVSGSDGWLGESLRSARRKSSPAPWLALTVLLLGTVAFFAARRDLEPATGIWSPERVTTGPGLEIDPAFSPDGTRMVYSAEDDDGTFSLFVQGLDATQPPVRLETGDDQAFEPTWSPDGELITYHSRSRGGLWILPAEGGGSPSRLTETGGRAAFSPGGETLVYQSVASPLLSDTTAPALSPSVIRLLPMADGVVDGPPRDLTQRDIPLGGHGSPSFSPDGQFVIFIASERSESEIWAVPTEGGEPHPVLLEPATAYDPVISADGRSVFYSSRLREVKGLWRIDVDPATLLPLGNPREVAGVGLSSVRQPTMSRDGRHLLFAAYLTRSNLHSLSIDAAGRATSPPSPLTLGNDRYSRPAFSPDGSVLAFDHWKLGVDIDIFTYDLATGQQTQVTSSPGTQTHASWLPSGQLIYTTINVDGSQSVRRISLAGQSAGQLAAPSAGQGSSARDSSSERSSLGRPGANTTRSGELLFELGNEGDWAVASPKGDRVAFHSSLGGQSLDVWIRELEGGQAWRLTFHDALAGFPCWSPLGDLVAYQIRVGSGSHLWVAPLDGSEPKPLVTEPGHNWPYSFSPDGSMVAYAAERDGRWNLEWVSVETGERYRLTDFHNLTGYMRYPTWSPAGDRIVFEKSETTSDLFLVRDFL